MPGVSALGGVTDHNFLREISVEGGPLKSLEHSFGDASPCGLLMTMDQMDVKWHYGGCSRMHVVMVIWHSQPALLSRLALHRLASFRNLPPHQTHTADCGQRYWHNMSFHRNNHVLRTNATVVLLGMMYTQSRRSKLMRED